MPAPLLFAFLVAVALLQAGREPALASPPRFTYHLPERFLGWACIDFGVSAAPPLSRSSSGTYELAPESGRVVATSSFPHLTVPPFASALRRDMEGQTRDIAIEEVQNRFEWDTNSPVSRACLFFGSAETARSVARPPSLRDSAAGTATVLSAFDFTRGSVCDFKAVERLCVDATDVRERNIGRTIAAVSGVPAVFGKCERSAEVVVRYRAEWATDTHTSSRGGPFVFAEVRKDSARGTVVLATYVDSEPASAVEAATRFGNELAGAFTRANSMECAE